MVEENDFLDLIKYLMELNLISSPVEITRLKNYSFHDIYFFYQNRSSDKKETIENILSIFEKYPKATTIDDLTPNKYKAVSYDNAVSDLIIDGLYDIHSNSRKYAIINTKKLLLNDKIIRRKEIDSYNKIAEYKTDEKEAKKKIKMLKKAKKLKIKMLKSGK